MARKDKRHRAHGAKQTMKGTMTRFKTSHCVRRRLSGAKSYARGLLKQIQNMERGMLLGRILLCPPHLWEECGVGVIFVLPERGPQQTPC